MNLGKCIKALVLSQLVLSIESRRVQRVVEPLQGNDGKMGDECQHQQRPGKALSLAALLSRFRQDSHMPQSLQEPLKVIQNPEYLEQVPKSKDDMMTSGTLDDFMKFEFAALSGKAPQPDLNRELPDVLANRPNVWNTGKGFCGNFQTSLKTPADLAHSPRAIQHYLSSRFFEQPELLEAARQKLQEGGVVVWRDAFKPQLADKIHAELDAITAWELNEADQDDGYHFSMHNIYNESLLAQNAPFTSQLVQVFDDPETKTFMEYLTGRNCQGQVTASPSFFEAGDHQLPHSDHSAQRTVAFVWHLAKNWRPEWGGAFYWVPTQKYWHAEFNTLYLFSVTRISDHLVTTVTPKAQGKRLAFNGWWDTDWAPEEIEDIETMLESEESQLRVTPFQMTAMQVTLMMKGRKLDAEHKKELLSKTKKLMADFEQDTYGETV